MAAAAERHQDERQDTYELVLNGIKNESDLAQQVALVDQMIALGVDAIVIAPADSKALVPALARARSSGIQVVNIDNQLDRDVLAEFDLAIPFIGPDNRKGAKAAAMVALQRYPEGRERRRSRRCDERTQRDRAPARVHRGDHRHRCHLADHAKRAVGPDQGGRSDRGDSRSPPGDAGHPRGERQHGPGRGVGPVLRRTGPRGRHRRLRQHLGGPPVAPGWTDPGDR